MSTTYLNLFEYEASRPTVIGTDQYGHAAVQVWQDGSRLGQDPGRYLTLPEAQAILTSIRKDTGVSLAGPYQNTAFNFSADPLHRADWYCFLGPDRIELAELFCKAGVAGVGAPGKWKYQNNSLVFVPTPPVSAPSPTGLPSLKPGQQYSQSGMMGDVVVIDKPAPSLTDSQKLDEILRVLKKAFPNG